MPKGKKILSGAEAAVKTPQWHDLFWVLSETADHLLRGVIRREDVPADVRDVLKGVLCLRETKELFYAEGDRISPFSAMLWSEELAKWAASSNDKISSVSID